ncbi:NAD(P)-dependent oxidoreductase [Gryllotalpicola koreensis]|uniref:NAD(P)-dependent oxidoreductase n=1 Tax=Gryllotalpicola koreensis TaxID=993086 RepID=A0ABP8A570_9MICO
MNGRHLGFIGLGIMGVPMAKNLIAAGFDLAVWARSAAPVEELVALGAHAAADVAGVFSHAETVVLMLRDEAAVDAVLARDTPEFGRLVGSHTIVQMGTFTTAYSQALAADVHAHGGRYVEAPVSGSRGPATEGTLVAMLAGSEDAIADIEPIIDAMCAQRFRCGPVPSALATKLAVNTFLITMVTGLAETFHFAARTGVDAEVLRAVLDAGPMSSVASRGKALKLTQSDFAPQAAIADVLKNARLVEDAAIDAQAAHPLTRASRELYEAAVRAGDGALDMIGVIAAFDSHPLT